MTHDTFSFPRFWNYFKYDLKQLWHNNGKAAIMLGFISVICYMVWVIGSLIFTGSWQAPGLAARCSFFALGALILVFYQTRTYGFLTDKQPGQAWLMIPASILEKFISMVFITVVLIPLAYLVSYLLLDGAITLVDASAGNAILTSFSTLAETVNHGLSAASEEGFQFNIGVLALPFLFQTVAYYLYFLLCGISFKKWKIIGGLAILLGLSFAITPLFSYLAVHTWAPMLTSYGSGDDPALIMGFVNAAMNWSVAIDVLLVVGLAIGIFFRLKNLKH